MMSFLLYLVPILASLVDGYAQGGRCGAQYGNAECDAFQGCCSGDGYCGTTDEYCLVSNGCQANCSNATTPANLHPSTSSAAATSSSKSVLPIGLIIGIVVGGFCLIVLGIIAFFWHRRSKTKAETARLERESADDRNREDARQRHELVMQQRNQTHDVEMAVMRQKDSVLALYDKYGPQAIQNSGLGRLQLGAAGTSSGRVGGSGGRVLGDLD